MPGSQFQEAVNLPWASLDGIRPSSSDIRRCRLHSILAWMLLPYPVQHRCPSRLSWSGVKIVSRFCIIALQIAVSENYD